MTKDIYLEKEGMSSLTSRIFNILRDEILEGKYIEGQKLVESRLANELGVSRTPVREGLKQLELEGLVESIPNRGVIVKGISSQDIEDILNIRLAIEDLAVELAMERIDKDELEDLKDIYELMEFYTMKNDPDKILGLNTQFHEVIYKATKSRYLNNMLRDFQQYIKIIREKSIKSPGRLKTALEEHGLIVDAFIEGDVQKGKFALKKHITTLKNNALNKKFSSED
ncbi:GntR family transcriptional regulator [Clostridium sp. D2Q-14]|uniref:GntR family transcriptional regulator n=1 Tax=Anaeromonas gelatinilytica TaxID=2683194 RepID=UPI00193C2297|nr:GntR family transcriptional regulator [Anaeromonas gelatinilytica]MBS4535499.1 GntR family transcriptional regulator [Anaeromonas gelatinilytica]